MTEELNVQATYNLLTYHVNKVKLMARVWEVSEDVIVQVAIDYYFKHNRKRLGDYDLSGDIDMSSVSSTNLDNEA